MQQIRLKKKKKKNQEAWYSLVLTVTYIWTNKTKLEEKK